MPKKHPRPAKDFMVTSLASQREIEAIHRRAGFEPIPDEVLVRRFWQFLRFIQKHGLTSRMVAGSAAELREDTALRNSDLTNEGFYFVQGYHERWLNRTRKDRGETKEEAFLAKWYDQFLLQQNVT